MTTEQETDVPLLQVLLKGGPWFCSTGHIVWGPAAGTGLQVQEGGMRDQSVQLRMRKGH